MTIRIEDTEKFIDEVSEVAYETAVDVVTDKVIEETHNADFDEIEKLKRDLTSDRSSNSPQVKRVISKTLDSLMKKFRGMTDHITGRLTAIFGGIRIRRKRCRSRSGNRSGTGLPEAGSRPMKKTQKGGPDRKRWKKEDNRISNIKQCLF